MTAITVRSLTVRFGSRRVVDDVSLTLSPGRILAIVGESGAGKSIAVRTLLGFTPAGATVECDELRVAGRDMRNAPENAWRAVRGAEVALVTQDALGALDPLRRVGAEVSEPLAVHGSPRSERDELMIQAMSEAGIPDVLLRARQYPHELSGGLRQRAVIASAIIADPGIIVADEPTTALDATVQARVLRLLRQLADDGRAIILVSHDLRAVADIADDIIVMQAGGVVESGPAERVLTQPRHEYTRLLWESSVRAAPVTAPREGRVTLTADGLVRRFGSRVAVDDVSVTLQAGTVLGIVGESGSGKTTLARILLGADAPDAGTVTIPHADDAARRRFVAQDPRAAFNPTWSLRRSLAEALRAAGVARADIPARAEALMHEVELEPALLDRRPSALSGGQLQRAAIARALAADPRILILDEPLSALDVSVGAKILALLARVRDERGVALAVISHDLAVIGEIADRVVVMRDGKVLEAGDTAQVFAHPQHDFTRELLTASGMGPNDIRYPQP